MNAAIAEKEREKEREELPSFSLDDENMLQKYKKND